MGAITRKIARPTSDSVGYACPKCGSLMGVSDTRRRTDGAIRRRRRCLRAKCGHRLTTLEVVMGEQVIPAEIKHEIAVIRMAVEALERAAEGREE